MDDGVEAVEVLRPDVADVEPKLGDGRFDGRPEVAAVVEAAVETRHLVARLDEDARQDPADVAVVAGDEDPHLGPELPGRRPARPELLEQLLVAHGVHALPEAVVPVRHQLAVACELLERLTLPLGLVARHVVEHARLEHEEGAVDPDLLDLRLLGELEDGVALEMEMAEPRGRPDDGDGRELAVCAVELEQAVESRRSRARRPT